MADRADSREPRSSAAGHPPGVTATAERVIHRMLLRRGCAIEPELALLVAQALQALFQASPAEVLQALSQASPAGRPPSRQRKRQPDPRSGCEPLF